MNCTENYKSVNLALGLQLGDCHSMAGKGG